MLSTGHFQKETLLAVLSGRYSRAEANAFGVVCHALALSAIRQQKLRLRLDHPAIVLDEQDVLQECFLQLFRRDGAGRFKELDRFFCRYCPEGDRSTEAVLLSTLRRLISAKISNGVVSVFCKSDPDLCRLLRNLRLALKHSTLFDTFDRFGEEHIRPRGPLSRQHLQCIPLDIVRARLGYAARDRDATPLMLRRVHGILVEEDQYQPAVPLVALALALRAVYAAESDGADTVAPVAPSDVDRLSPAVLRRLAAQWEASYVGRGKIQDDPRVPDSLRPQRTCGGVAPTYIQGG